MILCSTEKTGVLLAESHSVAWPAQGGVPVLILVQEAEAEGHQGSQNSLEGIWTTYRQECAHCDQEDGVMR